MNTLQDRTNANLAAERAGIDEQTRIERQRLQNLADRHLANSRALSAYYDAPMDESVTAAEIIDLVATTFTLSKLEAIDHMQAIDFSTARANLKEAA
jgi:hypothetical protein